MFAEEQRHTSGDAAAAAHDDDAATPTTDQCVVTECVVSSVAATTTTTRKSETSSPRLTHKRRVRPGSLRRRSNTFGFVVSSSNLVLFLQGVSIACYAEPCISYGRVVRPSVRLSV